MRDAEIDDYPIGTPVVTPLGRLATVIDHLGHESRMDPFERVILRYEGGARRDTVTLQPKLLVKLSLGSHLLSKILP